MPTGTHQGSKPWQGAPQRVPNLPQQPLVYHRTLRTNGVNTRRLSTARPRLWRDACSTLSMQSTRIVQPSSWPSRQQLVHQQRVHADALRNRPHRRNVKRAWNVSRADGMSSATTTCARPWISCALAIWLANQQRQERIWSGSERNTPPYANPDHTGIG